MSTVSERLAELAGAAFDTFGEPEDPTDPSEDLTPEEWTAIRDEIWDAPWNDPARFPDLCVEAVRVLGEIGLRGDTASRRLAAQSLRDMVYRVKNGAWRSEIEAEPAWSLDREEPVLRRVHDVVEDL